MGLGGIIMVFPDLIGFFTLKHKTDLDKLIEESNRTPQQFKTTRKRREAGAVIFAFGMILFIIGVFFGY